MRTRSWTDEQLAEAVRVSNCLSATVVALGLYPGSKMVARVRERIDELGLDRTHHRGGGRPRGEADRFRRGIPYTTTTRRDYLNVVPYECLFCGLSEWQGTALCLQVDHIDGDQNNNELSNLRLLCPNCHSQTETWSKKKSK